MFSFFLLVFHHKAREKHDGCFGIFIRRSGQVYFVSCSDIIVPAGKYFMMCLHVKIHFLNFFSFLMKLCFSTCKNEIAASSLADQ